MSKTSSNTAAAMVALIASFIVLFLKAKAYYITNSIGVFSDALETVVNILTAFMTLSAVNFASAPADEGHPYGHGKMEYFSAAFEGGLVLFAGAAVMFQSFKSFFLPPDLQNFSEGNVYLLVASGVNLLAGFYLIRQSKKNKSEALKASGVHLLSDVITTIGVLFGLLLVHLTGLMWIDSAVAALVGMWLVFEAFKILRKNWGALLDEADDELLDQLADIINKRKTPTVIDIHNLRVIRSGPFHHIDAHVVVPEYLDVATVHELTHVFEKNVVKDYNYDGEIAFHIDPCKKAYCRHCEIADCGLRQAEFQALPVLTKQHLIKGPQYTN